MKRSSLTKGYQNPKRKLEVTLLRYYGVFPCRLCSRNAFSVITLLQPSFLAGFAQQSLVTLLRGLSLPALLKKCLLCYYVITGSFLAGFAQEMLVTLLRYYGVFPCRLCSTIACCVITLLQPSFLAGFAQQSLVTLLRYYGVFPCRLCSRNACYVITLLRGLSLRALLKKCLLHYLRYYGVFPCRLCSTIACSVITLLQPSFLAGFAQQSLVTLLLRNACYIVFRFPVLKLS